MVSNMLKINSNTYEVLRRNSIENVEIGNIFQALDLGQ